MVKPVVDITWFSAQLWSLTGRRGMVILYAYAALGFLTLRALTPDFGLLAKQAIPACFCWDGTGQDAE